MHYKYWFNKYWSIRVNVVRQEKLLPYRLNCLTTLQNRYILRYAQIYLEYHHLVGSCLGHALNCSQGRL